MSSKYVYYTTVTGGYNITSSRVNSSSERFYTSTNNVVKGFYQTYKKK